MRSQNELIENVIYNFDMRTRREERGEDRKKRRERKRKREEEKKKRGEEKKRRRGEEEERKRDRETDDRTLPTPHLLQQPYF